MLNDSENYFMKINLSFICLILYLLNFYQFHEIIVIYVILMYFNEIIFRILDYKKLEIDLLIYKIKRNRIIKRKVKRKRKRKRKNFNFLDYFINVQYLIKKYKFIKNLNIYFIEFFKEKIYLSIILKVFSMIFICLILSEIIFMFINFFIKLDLTMNIKFITVIAYIYFFTGIIMSYSYSKIFKKSYLPLLVDRFNLNYEAIVGATILSLWIHLVLLIVFNTPEYLLIFRFVNQNLLLCDLTHSNYQENI